MTRADCSVRLVDLEMRGFPVPFGGGFLCRCALLLTALWGYPGKVTAEPRGATLPEKTSQDLADLLSMGLESIRESMASDPRSTLTWIGCILMAVAAVQVLALLRSQKARRELQAKDGAFHPVIDRRRSAATPGSHRSRGPAPPGLGLGSVRPSGPLLRDEPSPHLQPAVTGATTEVPRLAPAEDRAESSPSRALDVEVEPEARTVTEVELPVLRPTDPLDAEGRICQCFSLLAEGRFEEAVEVTRVGLDGHPDAGRVFGQLSRVATLVGRHDEAIALAARAFRAERSKERFKQLLQLRSAARRFEPREGDRLRRAVASNPEQPVYLRALGIFEALHGNVGAARRLLRAALRHEPGEETRGAIARELLQVEKAEERSRTAEQAPSEAALKLQ